MKSILLTIAVLLSQSSLAATSFEGKLTHWSQSKASPSAKMTAFYKLYWDYLMTTYPEWASYVAYPGQNDRWTDRSLAAVESRRQETKAMVKALRTVNEKQLKGEDLLNYQLLLFRLEEEVRNYQFPGHLLAITQMDGVQTELVDLFFFTPKKTQKDYADMIARLEKAPEIIKQTEELLKEGLRQGVTPPKVTLQGVPAQIDRILTKKIDDSPIYSSFKEIKSDLGGEEEARIQAKAKVVINDIVNPALKAFRDYVANEYIPHCRESVGWSALPNGKAWYNALIKHHTTTDLTADEIHELGLKEVARIRGEMEKIRTQVKFKGDLKKFNKFIRTDKQFFYSDTKDLLDGYRVIAKTIDPELPKFFSHLPRMTYGIREMPAFKAPNSPAAYYDEGNLEAGRPGYFNANTYDLKARPKWGMADITCHEAVPGHHFQIAVAQEVEGLPEYRKNMHYTAFVEGWGLYAETLCDEMGIYNDPYAKYGQLSGELWRAIRLVVDTGLHAKEWTRDQVMNYFRDNGAFSEQEIKAESDRYIVWAGQALAYKVGELKFKELRAAAKARLGDKFDVRKFHDALLDSGALPIKVLESKMTAWADRQANSKVHSKLK